LAARPSSGSRAITPNGHEGMQYPQPLQMSGWSTTVPNSDRISAPVGHASRQPAFAQCLHTSDMNVHLSSTSAKRTWRQVFAPSVPVLS
jgi:hypothetical protein